MYYRVGIATLQTTSEARSMSLCRGSQKGTSYILLTPSLNDQIQTENECRPFFVDLNSLPARQIEHLRAMGMISPNANAGEDIDASFEIRLMRAKHFDYLMTPFRTALRSSYLSLDSSRPWIVYWCLQGLDLLGCPLSEDDANRVIRTLKTCLTYEGNLAGFAGGPWQMAHCAPTYAAVLALSIIGGNSGTYSHETCKAAYEAIDRNAMYKWFLSLQHDYSVNLKSGKRIKRIGYRMHHDGEVDCRGTYTVLCIAKLLNILTDELTDGVAEYIASCQTYEGGFGAEFYNEAHGGYTYCAVAGLSILNNLDMCCVTSLRRFLARMQMNFEGGFAGRTNKLVDGCYTFWQGAAMAILNIWDDSPGQREKNSQKIPRSGVIEKIIEVGLSDEIDIDEIKHIDESGNLSVRTFCYS